MFKPRNVGWLVGLEQEWLREGGGNCLQHLKNRWNRKERRENKVFNRGGGKLGQGVGALKMGR